MPARFSPNWTAFLALAALTACSATDPNRSEVRESGFLTDYSRLQEGGKDQPNRYFIASDARLGRFRKVHIAPIELWLDEESKGAADRSAAETLVASLKQKAETALSAHFDVVEVPDGQTLVIRGALTQSYGSFVPLNVLSTVVPEGFILSKATQWTTGWRPFVGKAAIEAEFTEGPGGRVLVQVTDARIGNKTIDTGLLKTWGDVEQAFDVWAKQLDEFLVWYVENERFESAGE
jgi:hypothetical protein